MAVPPPPRPAAQAVRHLGRFQLLRLLGKSVRTMLWLVADPRAGQEMVLLLPRTQPADAAAMQRWLDAARRSARIDHPNLRPAVEVGEHDRWPYIAYDRGNTATLAERLGSKGLPAAELVPWMLQALQGLAFAHEAGLAHHDVQANMLALTDNGVCSLMGLGVVLPPEDEADALQAQRRAAERDVLALGLVLHHALAGTPPLELADTAAVIERMPPLGRDIVRLPWTGAHTVPEPLRAIVNRATDRQERQRYRSARTLERALNGWLRTDGEAGGGPIMLLLDRMRAAGLMPAMPGGASRAARLASLERQRSTELAAIVIEDVGLSFELLRQVNSVAQRSALGGGNGAILTIRRAIEMLGIDGVRRAAATLRPWPGPLNEAHAAELSALLERVRLAGRVAQWLRPAGYDPEVVYLLAMLQSLGRLAVQYHFPEEAAQIRRLMLPAPPLRTGEPEDPGMGEEGASFAVLGVDIDALGAAVARHWDLDDAVVHMMRRVPWTAPVHAPDGDDDLLRLTASCANEVVDSRAVPAHHRLAWLQRVVQRYGRVLGVGLRDVQLAAQGISPQDDPADAAAGAAPRQAGGACHRQARRSPAGGCRSRDHPMTLAPGALIGRYRLISPLGSGAQATVWRAHDDRLDRDVALKLLNAEASRPLPGQQPDQWMQEARAVSRLAHPHIVPVFDAEMLDGRACLVFELVTGSTLSERLRQRGRMPAREAVELMLGVVDALRAAHAQGIVHRDLKPSNILLDTEGRARVMDFGIAARLHADAGADPLAGCIVGTPGYLSPEAAAAAAPSGQMDVFAAGLVLGELLTGQRLLAEQRAARCAAPGAGRRPGAARQRRCRRPAACHRAARHCPRSGRPLRQRRQPARRADAVAGPARRTAVGQRPWHARLPAAAHAPQE